MQATPHQKTGSFGIPKAMQENINARENQKIDEAVKTAESQPNTQTVSPSSSVDDIAKVEKDKFEEELVKQKVQLKLAVERIETNLGIKITQTDILDMVKKGRVTKNPVTIIKDALTVGFQTLTGEDVQAIENEMFETRKGGDKTAYAIENENVFWKLSYGLSSYQGKDTSAVKDKSKIKSQLTKLSASVLERMNKAYNDYTNLINLNMEDTDFLKK